MHTHGSHGSHSFHRLAASSTHYFPTPRGSYYVKRLAYTATIKPSGLNSETSCIIKALPTGFARCIKPTRGGAAPPRLDFPSRTESIVNHSSSAGIFVGNHHLRPFDFRRIERKRAASGPAEKNRGLFAFPFSSFPSFLSHLLLSSFEISIYRLINVRVYRRNGEMSNNNFNVTREIHVESRNQLERLDFFIFKCQLSSSLLQNTTDLCHHFLAVAYLIRDSPSIRFHYIFSFYFYILTSH